MREERMQCMMDSSRNTLSGVRPFSNISSITSRIKNVLHSSTQVKLNDVPKRNTVHVLAVELEVYQLCA